MGAGAAQGFWQRQALERLAAGDVKDQRVPRGRDDRLREATDALPAEPGPGVFRRRRDRGFHGSVVNEVFDHPASAQPLKDALVRTQVRPLDVDRRQTGLPPGQAVA